MEVLPDSRGMGIVDRPVVRLPSHPHPPKLKEILKVLPQVTDVPVHFPPFRTSHSPPGLYNDCNRSKTNVKEVKLSEVIVKEVKLISGGSPSEPSGSGRPNPVLGVDNKSGKI